MSIERHDVDPSKNRDAWLALRGKDVTASTVGALFGVHEFQTSFGLWALKSGQISEDPEESEPMRRGRLLEPVAVQLLSEDHPTWKVEQPGIYLRDTETRLGATPDCFAIDPNRPGFGNLQIKSVEASIFNKKWKDPDTGIITPPLWIALQSIVEASLSGASWAAVAPLVVGHGIECPVIEIPIHAKLFDQAKGKTREFWRMIAEGRQPEPNFGRDGAVLNQLYAEDDGGDIDLSADNELPALAAERDQLALSGKATEKRIEEIKNVFKHRMGNAKVCVLADGRTVTWGTVRRSGYSVEPTTYRQMRFGSANGSSSKKSKTLVDTGGAF